MKLGNEFLDCYLRYVEDTESPRAFHLWSALTGVAACAGRRLYLPFGNDSLYCNMFTLLVGPPAVRKSTAMRVTSKLMREATGVRFAPDDTSGQRQGLISAIAGDSQDSEDATQQIINAFNGTTNEDALDSITLDDVVSIEDKHTIFVAASELNSFLGHNNLDMLTFLIKMWDGDDYTYKLKTSQAKLENPLVNLLGCTTPTNIATALPPEAIGQGFMSRMILVYGDMKYKSIPRPKPLPEEEGRVLKGIFSRIFNMPKGEMKEDEKAAKLIDELYAYDVKVNDPRFIYYCERRHVHLIKASMTLALARGSTTISFEDVDFAHKLLEMTEQSMPDALGEYGLSPLALASQKLIEFIRSSKSAIPREVLWAFMQRDMRIDAFHSLLADLTNAGKLAMVTIPGVGHAYAATISEETRKSRAGLEELGGLV